MLEIKVRNPEQVADFLLAVSGMSGMDCAA